ncbi:MAG: hypothetical protein ACKOE2_03005 [Actinomycetales bacterium]
MAEAEPEDDFTRVAGERIQQGIALAVFASLLVGQASKCPAGLSDAKI